jgi:hypothetical protein
MEWLDVLTLCLLSAMTTGCIVYFAGYNAGWSRCYEEMAEINKPVSIGNDITGG